MEKIPCEEMDEDLTIAVTNGGLVQALAMGEERQECMIAPAELECPSEGLNQLRITTASSQDSRHTSVKVESREHLTLARAKTELSPLEESNQESAATVGRQDPGPPSMLPLHEAGGIPRAVERSKSPLPYLAWVNSSELWHEMRSKDICKAVPELDFIARHPSIPPNCRMSLLDWMMEVCEDYKLQRETYYLALDIYDRFMDAQDDFPIGKLQLLGATCLFLASKIDASESCLVAFFVYATENSFQVADVLNLELVICEVLDWKVGHHSVTVNMWTKVYLQIASNCLSPPGPGAKPFEYPMYSTDDYLRVMQLLDFCCLDIASRQFGNSVLAASAVYVVLEKHRTSLGRITGFKLADIQQCVDWLHPFSEVISKRETSEGCPSPMTSWLEEDPNNWHNFQDHDFDMEEEYGKVQRLRLRHLQAASGASGFGCT